MCHDNVFTVELFPDLLSAIDPGAVRPMNPGNLWFEGFVTDEPCARGTRPGGVIGAGSELQGSADRLDSPSIFAQIDVMAYRLV